MAVSNWCERARRSIRPWWALCVFVGALFIFSSEGAAFSYTVRVSDQNAIVEFYGMALDANGNPGIGYIDTSSGTNVLKFAHWDGSSWETKTVDSGCTNWDIWVAYNPSTGNPGISYNYGGKYAYYDPDDGWVTESVTSKASGYRGSLAYDKDGNPTIALKDSSGKTTGLKLAKRDASTGAWSFQMIDKAAATGYPSLAYDSTGSKPAVTYRTTETVKRTTTYYVKCAWYDGSAWNIRTVASSTNPYAYAGYLNQIASVAFDANDKPAVEYICRGSSDDHWDIKIAHWTDAGWNTETVVTEGNYVCNPGKPSLVYAGNTPYIAYCLNPDNANGKIKLAYKSGDGFTTETVDTLGVNSGTFSATMGIKVSGASVSPVVAYTDEVDFNKLHCAFGS